MPKINKNKRLILHWIPLFTRNISELEFQKYSANYEVSQSNIQKKTTNVQSCYAGFIHTTNYLAQVLIGSYNENKFVEKMTAYSSLLLR